MIQIKRGKTENWRKAKNILKSGQPGYDKDKHKIKIGDGVTSWKELPYASGLFEEEILDSETNAALRHQADSEDTTIFTYGKENPSNNIIGKVYLQHYEADIETDYVIAYGTTQNWFYRKWQSGLVECWGAFNLTTKITTQPDNDNFYKSCDDLEQINYPVTFAQDPVEIASVQGNGNFVWIASNKINNSKTMSGQYSIVSTYKLPDSVDYKISLHVYGKIDDTV